MISVEQWALRGMSCVDRVFLQKKRDRERKSERQYINMKLDTVLASLYGIYRVHMECVYNKHMFAERRVF